MKKITNTFNGALRSSKTFTLLVLVMFAGSAFAQAVTDVFPTRVTTNSVVTLIGSNFSPETVITINGISTNSMTFINSNEMSINIAQEGTFDISGNIIVGGVSTSFNVDYIAPTIKVLSNGAANNLTRISEIFTTWNGFWRSSEYNFNSGNTWPNDSHDLLAFTYGGVTYSTGVNDQLLTDNGVSFSPQLFFAYSTNGVTGITNSGNYLATGDLVDGEVGEGTEITSPAILDIGVYDAIIDGVNGLDLGTGITNFNEAADVQFFSAGGNLGAVDDVIPDFLVTQIARGGASDLYFYADSVGNIVGRPIELTIREDEGEGAALLARWRLDLYDFPNGINYGLARPTERIFGANDKRPLRMAAFRMEEFGINSTNVVDINNLNLVAAGRSDLAFLAYNRGSFDIKTPVFSQFPVSRFVCELPSNASITFVCTGVLSGAPTGDPLETLSYQWFKYNTPIAGATSNTYTLTGNIQASDIATYKVRISNGFGAVVAPVTLTEGGVPTFWDGTSWVLPPTYVAAGITVEDAERELIFSQDYVQETGVLEGCDCTVPSGSNVTFGPNTTLKLLNDVTVQAGGSLVMQDDANLIQTKISPTRPNFGSIVSEREVTNTVSDDFLFWSTPVERFDVSGITAPFSAPTFEYDVNAINTDGTAGDWVPVSELMMSGKGYIVQVPNEFVPAGFTSSFEGIAVNGPINVDVFKSPTETQPSEEQRHWNLIGNPYPSAVNVEEFLTANSSLNGNVRFWSNGNTSNSAIAGAFYSGVTYDYGDQYVTYNRTGSTPDMFGGNIASGQGFIVQLDESSGPVATVNFSNDMRFDDSEIAYDNSQFVETNQSSSVPSSPNNQLVWLSLVDNSNVSSVALVGYVNGATNDKDKMYDAFSDGGALRIFSTVNGSKMAIQGRALPFTDEDLVPLGIDLPTTGTYSIGIDQLQGSIFGGSQGIYLEDTLLEVVHDLRTQPYSFSGSEGSTLDRFILRYTPEELSIDEVDDDVIGTYVFIRDNQLNIRSSSKIKAVTVYDLTGKQIADFIPSAFDTSFTVPFNFARGMYITVIKIGDQNEIEVTRKLMN